MSALAQYFHEKGLAVYGYDRVKNANVDKLELLGIPIVFDDKTDLIDPNFCGVQSNRALVIYTPAIPKTNEILGFLKSRGYDVIKRSEALQRVTDRKSV